MKMGIRTKLLGAFAIVMLMAIAIGAVGIISLGKVNNAAVLVYDEPFTFDRNLTTAQSFLER